MVAGMLDGLVDRLKTRQRETRVGIELDGRVVRAAQLRRTATGWTLTRSTEFLLPPNVTKDERAGLLRHVLRRRGFSSMELSICLPVGSFQSDLLDLSENKGAAPIDAARAMFARAMRCPAEAMEVVCWPRRGNDPKVFAIAMTHSGATEFISPFEEAGMDIAAMGCPASAMARVARKALETDPGNCSAVIRLGYSSHLVVLCAGGQVIYQRTLDTAGWSAMSAEMSIERQPHAQDPEVRRHLSAVGDEAVSTLECVPKTFGGLQVGRVLVSGVAADEMGVLNVLAARIGRVEPLALGGISTQPGCDRFDLACGSALSEERA